MILILIILAAILNVIMDWSSEGKLSGYWNKAEGWKYKYKGWVRTGNNKWTNKITNTRYWYYLGLFKTTYPERFPFSTTILVFLTDGWHLCQFLYNRTWQLAIVLLLNPPHPLIMYLFIGAIYGMVFEFIYRIKK